MLKIKKSSTADTRTCDFKNVSIKTLLESSCQHIDDVRAALNFFVQKVEEAARVHDSDKISNIKGFHADFLTGFKETTWWDEHRKINRHHLNMEDGIPADVNLIDVLDYIADCVMAGMGRTGTVTPLDVNPVMLMRAFSNTIELLKEQVVVEEQ